MRPLGAGRRRAGLPRAGRDGQLLARWVVRTRGVGGREVPAGPRVPDAPAVTALQRCTAGHPHSARRHMAASLLVRFVLAGLLGLARARRAARSSSARPAWPARAASAGGPLAFVDLGLLLDLAGRGRLAVRFGLGRLGLDLAVPGPCRSPSVSGAFTWPGAACPAARRGGAPTTRLARLTCSALPGAAAAGPWPCRVPWPWRALAFGLRACGAATTGAATAVAGRREAGGSSRRTGRFAVRRARGLAGGGGAAAAARAWRARAASRPRAWSRRPRSRRTRAAWPPWRRRRRASGRAAPRRRRPAAAVRARAAPSGAARGRRGSGGSPDRRAGGRARHARAGRGRRRRRACGGCRDRPSHAPRGS